MKKNLIQLILSTLFIFNSIACSKKEDPSNTTNTAIVGIWDLISIQSISYSDNTKVSDTIEFRTKSDSSSIEFTTNGLSYATLLLKDDSGKILFNFRDTILYTYSNNTLYTREDNSVAPTPHPAIISGNELSITDIDSFTSGGHKIRDEHIQRLKKR